MTIMIGELVELLGAPRSRSTWRPRHQAENHQELPAASREAAEILAAIESTGGARAAVDVVRADRCRALRAHVESGAVGAALSGAWAASRPVVVCPASEVVGA